MEDVIIIGAGLSGLSTAYNLKKQNIGVKILEAQNRVGGRIETVYGKMNTPMEMGATWFNNDHKSLLQLLSDLEIGYFNQYSEGFALYDTSSFEPIQKYFVPGNTHSGYRIKGGTSQIIEALIRPIGRENIILNTQVKNIKDKGDYIQIADTLNQTFDCKKLIFSIPPKLLINLIDFVPSLPQETQEVMERTQTWMSGSTKFSVEYSNPFWIENGFSGSVYSLTGLISEVYDHSSFDNTSFSLMGFLNPSAIHYTLEERRDKIISQLKLYFGEPAGDFLTYRDKIWDNQFIQPEADNYLPPHYNNGHPIFEMDYWNHKLFFTGTESSKSFPGYMEGAIWSSKAVTNRVSDLVQK